MAFVLSDLDVLDKAIAQGAMTVKYGDKEVTYRSLNEMFQLREQIKDELGLNGTATDKGRRYACFDKGIK